MEPAVDLSQLRDIHLPTRIDWWPLAPGWWIILVLVFVALLALYGWYRHWQRQHWRREALAELKLIQQNGTHYQQIAQINVLLRRILMHCYPRQQVAALTGEQWLARLEQLGGKLDIDHRLILDAPYMKDQVIDLTDVFENIHQWITSIPTLNRRKQVDT